jgi:hypothetical protein
VAQPVALAVLRPKSSPSAASGGEKEYPTTKARHKIEKKTLNENPIASFKQWD